MSETTVDTEKKSPFIAIMRAFMAREVTVNEKCVM